MNKSKCLEILTKEMEIILKNQLNTQNASNTYRTYRLHCVSFIRWVAENYGCATLTAARSHVTPWLQSRTKLSKNTRMVDASALAKLYDEDRRCFLLDSPYIQSPSPGMLRIFCMSTGLVGHELPHLKKNCLVRFNHQYFIRLEMPGELRMVPVIDNREAVTRIIAGCSSEPLWTALPDCFDYETPRDHYIMRLYQKLARPVHGLAESERYRLHSAERVLDKRALFAVAQSTGIYDYQALAQKIDRLTDSNKTKS
ncbi:hypothetical protein SAMN04515624_11963 [Eubacterium maltosivorans]|uniref:hypothetical protein n=1 Tax=Eubacterium maltosivorans TaxID=2041044 RepID=UPI00088A25F3|nr:hypothetical protein [Eubacterium maltosivorans]WPK81520.1 hypothetical protein EUMA32_29750 [Eubacterium maltosivorans]SDP63686.1 hypothetical protein SAMN04515624_11963 [Eubacterium maltosivorans]